MRKKIYAVIEPNGSGNRISTIYDYVMMVMIVLSLIPLAFKTTNIVFHCIEYVTVVMFAIDYVLRWITADLKNKKTWKSFLLYPFTPMAIIDMLSMLPLARILHDGFRLLRLVRLSRTMRVLRALKFIRYSKSIGLVVDVFKKQKQILGTIASVAVAYVLVSALVIFNVEPQSFETFFEAVYWSVISLTTIGYGDFYPVTAAGRMVTILSAMVGIAVIALPSGVITAGFLEELKDKEDS